CGDGGCPGIRVARGAGVGPDAVSRQGVVPPTGAAAADSARDYYGTFAAHVIQRSGRQAEFADDYPGARNSFDFGGYHRSFRGIAETRSRAGRGVARPGSELLADVLAHHGAESEAVHHWRGSA